MRTRERVRRDMHLRDILDEQTNMDRLIVFVGHQDLADAPMQKRAVTVQIATVGHDPTDVTTDQRSDEISTDLEIL